MYNDTIKAENKIISNKDLTEIFQLMNDTLKKYKDISNREEQQNKLIEHSYQKYTFKDSGSFFKSTVDFYDNTNITFDNCNNFMSIFYSRIDEIKSMEINFCLSYEVINPEPYRSMNFYSQRIRIYINEDKINITADLKSDDKKLDDIYNLIKMKIQNSPEKYDYIIKNKNKITNTIALSNGIIPSILVALILLFVPTINHLIFKGYIVYPIIVLIMSFVIGNMFGTSKVDSYYKNIVPNKKISYSSGERRESDDVDNFMKTSDVLIGKKVNNLNDRNLIKEEYEKSKMLLPKLFFAVVIVSLIVIIIGLII